MTLKELWHFANKHNSEDLEYETDNYFAVLAIEYHGLAVRDNSKSELIAIGKGILNDYDDNEF